MNQNNDKASRFQLIAIFLLACIPFAIHQANILSPAILAIGRLDLLWLGMALFAFIFAISLLIVSFKIKEKQKNDE